MNKKLTLSTLSALALICQASAATFVTSSEATGAATGAFANAFGLVSGTVTINTLGAYDSGASATLADPLTVTLWIFGSATPLRQVTIPAGAVSPVGNFVYSPITPIVLDAANYYAITVEGFTVTTPFNKITPAVFDTTLFNLISGSEYTTGNPYDNYGTTPAYGAGSFQTAPVPEPETYAMMAGLGLVGFGLYRRCRK